jgi:hypothetical protein
MSIDKSDEIRLELLHNRIDAAIEVLQRHRDEDEEAIAILQGKRDDELGLTPT